MNIKRITTDEAFAELRAGRTIMMLTPVDSGISVAEVQISEFVIEDAKEVPPKDLSFAEMLGQEPEEAGGVFLSEEEQIDPPLKVPGQ